MRFSFIKLLVFQLFVYAISYSSNICAQTIDYNKIIIPNNVSIQSIEEKLVRLAWDNQPKTKILQANLEAAKLDKKLISINWLDNFYFSANFNEFNVGPDYNPGEGNQFYPRYNFGIRVSFGDFIITPIQASQKKKQISVEEANINDQMLILRVNVLNAYSEYKANEEIFKIKSEMVENVYNIFALKEQQFKLGEILFEEYIDISSQYNNLRIEKINSNNLYLQSKYKLESLIGVKIEEVN